ncbi:MAG: transglycosylase SLT domain-containing protein, partial [Candidatus Competibacteraceae bacterium]|nr:transglycosylase SLT domain-containing protein [Candidatus Competibacteraceae bacterium]
LFVASRGDPSAPGRLAALPAEAVDEAVWEWRVRIGLQRQDWRQTLDWIEGMPPQVARQDQWRYWRARALEALDRSGKADALYRALAEERSYYGFLAADRVGAPYRLNPDPVNPDPQTLAALEARPGLLRARELLLLGRAWQGRVEWNHVLEGLDEQALKQAALLAHGWGWHDRAIATLGRARHWGDLEVRFPLPHRARVLAAARAEAIDPAWIYGVMRQESIFQPDVRSHAGALGLMQIMPATGRQIARRLKVSHQGHNVLLDEATNIRYGAHYLRLVLDQLQDSPLLATAAYNAGPSRVKSWLPPGPLAPDIWAELIPFHETRKYVKRVMEYATIYQQLLGRNAESLAQRMPLVLPKAL